MTGAFERLAEPFRRELKLHCYRMLGSVHDAEDLVQETFLRAWRGFGRFDDRGPGALRAWLYRIATNACLDALAGKPARLLPPQRGPDTSVPPPDIPATELAWLEPYPDAELDGIADAAPGPEARYAAREAVQLAFVAVIQQLPPRQRAVLLLREVLGWSAAESAELLGGTVASVNSALQRARETLDRQPPVGRPPPDLAQQALLGRYVRAWDGQDLDGLVALLAEDAACIMPPWQEWYRGRDRLRWFFGFAWTHCGQLRLMPTAANRQPAFAVYARTTADAPWAAHSLQVLTLDQERVAGLAIFMPPAGPRLFPAFGLPPALGSGL